VRTGSSWRCLRIGRVLIREVALRQRTRIATDPEMSSLIERSTHFLLPPL
jgi:hypothetical protein